MTEVWTPERVARLKQMWAEGRSGAAIARDLGGVSPVAVRMKAQRLGLERGAAVAIRPAQGARPAVRRVVVPYATGCSAIDRRVTVSLPGEPWL